MNSVKIFRLTITGVNHMKELRRTVENMIVLIYTYSLARVIQICLFQRNSQDRKGVCIPRMANNSEQ